jgi:hypothetical protein
MSIDQIFTKIKIVSSIPNIKKHIRYYDIFSVGGKPFCQDIETYADFRRETEKKMRDINPKCDIKLFTNPTFGWGKFYVKFNRYPIDKDIIVKFHTDYGVKISYGIMLYADAIVCCMLYAHKDQKINNILSKIPIIPKDIPLSNDPYYNPATMTYNGKSKIDHYHSDIQEGFYKSFMVCEFEHNM